MHTLGQLACALRSVPRELQAHLATALHASSLVCNPLQKPLVCWQHMVGFTGCTGLPSNCRAT